MKRLLFFFGIVICATINVHAQSIGLSTLNATGGTAVIGANEFDWSVGEMTMVSTFTTAGIIVTQGVLQPYENPSARINNVRLTKQLLVFPNPASSVVNIQYSSPSGGTLAYKLMDMSGRVISKHTINVNQGITTEQVNVSELACATYMLEVTVNAGTASPESNSYKIQKLQ